MSETDAEAPKPRKRRRWLYTAAGVVLAATGIGVGLGPAAPWVVDQFVDGIRVWRLGQIQIDGVSGGWLGDLRAEHISIADEEGVWIELNDVDLAWRPLDVAFGAIRLNEAHAHSIVVHRQPRLSEPKPPGRGSFDIRLGNVRADTITIEEAVVGAAAEFTADLDLDIEDERLRLVDLTLRRNDSEDDRIVALYRDGADYALHVDAASAPGGVLARALGVGEQGFTATADGNGDIDAGNAAFNARIGAREILTGDTRWRGETWAANVNADLEVLPQTAELAQRLGPRVSAQLEGGAEGAISAHAETPFLAVDINGALNERQVLEGPARFVATTSRLSDVARESPFELGAARLEGELRQARGTTAIRATLDAQDIEALGRSVHMTGPVEASLTQDRFQLEGDLRAANDATPLFANARLQTTLEYDRRRARFELTTASLNGDALALSAQGWTAGADGEFSGQWRLRQAQALTPDLRGEAGGDWRAFRQTAESERIWTVAVAGDGARITGDPAIVPQLLGAAPHLDGRFAYENRGITVSHVRVNGEQMRAGASGRIVNGVANLSLEATARGPLNIGAAQIAGAVDITGRVTGRIARPTLTAQASLQSFAAGDVVVEQPVIDFTLAPSGNGYAGRAAARGNAMGQPFNAESNVAIADGALRFSELDGEVGALEVQGEATLASAGPSANLRIAGALDGLATGVSGQVNGTVALTPNLLVVDAQLANARAGELRMRAANVHASGPLNAIAATFTLRGRLREAPLTFDGRALVDIEGSPSVRIEGRGALADADIFTRAPILAEWRNGATTASLNVAMADGVVQAQWSERRRALSGTVDITDAPLAPLAAIWGETAVGRIDGHITLANSGRGLSGNADITLDDARFAGRQRGTLDMHIVGDLDPSRLMATVDASSTEGLTAHFEANAPVITSADPIRIALAPERRGRATWTVHGPAESLWAAARLQDQSLEGQLDGEGEIEFGAGYLSGDGEISISNGRFEDKLTGVTLVDLDARVAIDERGVTIENFSAAGPSGGRLTATGGSANEREGRIVVRVNDMRVADRPDARATASGELTLAWEGLHSSLSGNLNIDQADLDISANPEAGIPTLDVIEINRPGQLDEEEPDEDAIVVRNGSTELDVHIRAPGRVFTRGRGIDAEWSLDLRLQGTSRNPRLFGEARAVRGTLALSGQPFEIDEARIFFNGDPLDAQIDMTAVRDTADLTARIRLTGTARDPQLTFSSDPPLPEDEILPQVLFGRSVEDLSPFEAAQLAASLAALSGRASLDLVDAARAAAGLDRFNVRQDEAGGFLVAGGVYLTRDVYLEVARTGLGETQTRVEWTLRPRLVLVTSFLGNGDQRVSLRWRRESD